MGILESTPCAKRIKNIAFKNSAMVLFACVTLASLGIASKALAMDDLKADFDAAKALFDSRSATDPQPIEKARVALAELEKKAQGLPILYDVLVLESHLYYWKGTHSNSNSEKKEFHATGQKLADKAIPLKNDCAEAQYFAGINLGRWGQANGALASLIYLPDLKNYIQRSIEKKASTGEPGETVDGYGPHRLAGRLYYELPSFAGNDLDLSKEHLETAYSNAKNYAINVVYYATTLSKAGSDEDKELAKTILDELLAQDPLKYNPSRIPETLEEFQDAKELRKKLGR